MLTDLISTNIPALKPTDTGSEALRLMDELRLSHLPIVDNTEYFGLVSENDIYELDDENFPVSSCRMPSPIPYVVDTQHILEVLAAVTGKNLTLIPVLSAKNNNYLGVITQTTLLQGLASATSATMQGGIIEIITTPTNYSPALITSVIEANDMKAMSLFTRRSADDVEIVVKLNGHNTSAVISGLERHGYRTRSVFEGDSKYTDLMEERYGALLKYMSV